MFKKWSLHKIETLVHKYLHWMMVYRISDNQINIIKHLLHVCLEHREHDATVQNPVGSSHVAQTQHQWPVAWVHTVNVGQWLPSRHMVSGDSICCIVPASKTVYLTHIEILSGMLKFPSVTRHSSWEQVLQMGSRKSKC